MSTARHSGLTVSAAITQPKARHSGLTVATAVTLPRAHHSGLTIKASNQPIARHSGLTVTAAANAVPTQFIKTASGALVPLGPPIIVAPPYPAWGPYGELGAYIPWANTSGATWESGSAPNGTLTGDQYITSPGTILEGYEIFGAVFIRCAGVRLRNCWVWGSLTAPTTNSGIVNCTHAACVDAVVEDCTLVPQTPVSWWEAVRGHDYKARRNHVIGITDGFSVISGTNDSNVEIDANLIERHGYRTDPQQGDGHTHNDGVQFHSAKGVKVRGNNFQSYTDPAFSNLTNPYASTGNQVTGQSMLLQPQNGNLTDILIQWNYYGGGGEANIHFAPKTLSNGQPGLVDNVRVWGNRFERTQRPISGVKHTVRIKASSTITNVDVPLSGDNANLYADTLTPITVTS